MNWVKCSAVNSDTFLGHLSFGGTGVLPVGCCKLLNALMTTACPPLLSLKEPTQPCPFADSITHSISRLLRLPAHGCLYWSLKRLRKTAYRLLLPVVLTTPAAPAPPAHRS